jgi:hypothetical protein
VLGRYAREVSAELRLRDDGLVWQKVDDEIVALDVRRNEYLAVNATGVEVWTALADGALRSELIERLARRFGIDAERAERDLDGFIDSLRERDLLEEPDSS